jgi:hypothetical protein
MRKTFLFLAAILLAGCTANERARQFGGTVTVDLPPGRKLVNATWKEQDLWYLHRPARTGETPEVVVFSSKSSFGIVEGSVVFKEK